MSDITPVAQREVPEGYAQRTITVGGVPMTFTFYLGFASRVTHTPSGGEEILVYQQEGVFQVPGGGGPAESCKMWITGGPDDLDVELEIDDSPRVAPDFRGPIEGFNVVTRRNGGGGGQGRVRAQKGGNKVASIRIKVRGEGGGVFPHMPGDGGDTGVNNDAVTCPPTC